MMSNRRRSVFEQNKHEERQGKSGCKQVSWLLDKNWQITAVDELIDLEVVIH